MQQEALASPPTVPRVDQALQRGWRQSQEHVPAGALEPRLFSAVANPQDVLAMDTDGQVALFPDQVYFDCVIPMFVFCSCLEDPELDDLVWTQRASLTQGIIKQAVAAPQAVMALRSQNFRCARPSAMRKVAEAQAGGQFVFSAGGGSAKASEKAGQ